MLGLKGRVIGKFLSSMKKISSTSPLAPVVLFAYKRVETLAKTIEALLKNPLVEESTLYVFIDGPKGPADVPKVDQVKALVDSIRGFKRIERHYSEVNRGLANSVIRGVSQVLADHQSVIVLEDDLITAPTFLSFMNTCLQTYEHNAKVFAVSGYTFPFKKPANYAYDAYFFPRHGSWGWATWKDRWEQTDWQVTDYAEFMLDKKAQQEFSAGGDDLVRMLRRQMSGEMDSWAIRWAYSQYKNKAYTLYPVWSKVDNIGFDQDATHTNIFNRYKTTLDQQETGSLRLPSEVTENSYYTRVFRDKYTVSTRIYNRLKTYIGIR